MLIIQYSSLLRVPTLSRWGAGSITAGDNLFVLAAIYQWMEMTLVKSLHSGDPTKFVK
jgi:hypothetical protein